MVFKVSNNQKGKKMYLNFEFEFLQMFKEIFTENDKMSIE